MTGNGGLVPVVLTADDVRRLGDGPVTVSAVQTDAAGNRQTASASSLLFTLDSTAPAAATLTLGPGVANGATAAEAAAGVVMVSGEEFATINVVFVRGTKRVTKTIVADGTLQAVPLDANDVLELGDGRVTVQAFQVDAAGNRQTLTPRTVSFVLDTKSPDPVAIALGTGVADGATAAEATQLSGVVLVRGEPQAAVSVTFSRAAQEIKKSVVASGSFQSIVLSKTEIATLGDGLITLKAIQTDSAGNQSAESATEFTLAAARPASPSLALQSDTGSNTTDGVTSNGTVSVSDIAENATWQYSTNGGASWSRNLPETTTSFTLPAGSYAAGRIQVRQTTRLGNTSAPVARNPIAYVVDSTTPTVRNVTSPASNGTYGVGQTVAIQVIFSERVFVTGAPKLFLNTSPSRSATYASGSGTDTLTFTYTPELGDTSADLSYASSDALDDGVISDLAGNAAIRTLAGPLSRGSLGFNKNIVIQAVIAASSPGFGTSAATAPQFSSAVDRIQITFNVDVKNVTIGAFRLYRDNQAVSIEGATVTGVERPTRY